MQTSNIDTSPVCLLILMTPKAIDYLITSKSAQSSYIKQNKIKYTKVGLS